MTMGSSRVVSISYRYHNRWLTLLCDKTGGRCGKVKGLRVFADGREIAKTNPHGRMIGIHPGPGPEISSQEFAKDDWMGFGEYAQA